MVKLIIFIYQILVKLNPIGNYSIAIIISTYLRLLNDGWSDVNVGLRSLWRRYGSNNHGLRTLRWRYYSSPYLNEWLLWW